jgi:phage shock protein C
MEDPPVTEQQSPFDSPNPHRLYRNPQDGKIFGVCAGLADYFGIDAWLLRILFILGLLFFFPPTFFGYLIAALLLKPKPPRQYRSREEEEFWRAVSTEPERTFSGLRHRMRELDRRLGGMESYVTSKEFELNRAINDLDRGR